MAKPLPGLDVPVIDLQSGMMIQAWFEYFQSNKRNFLGEAKAWVEFTGSAVNGNQTIGSSYNVASIARTSQGQYTVTFTTRFATANYVCIGNPIDNATVNGFVKFLTLATGSVVASFVNISGPAAFDPTAGASLAFFGTQ